MPELGLHVWWWKHPRMPMWWVGLNSKSVWAGVIFFCLKVAALCIKALLFKKLKNSFLKSLLNLLQYCFHFMFCFFGCKASGISAPWLGTKLALPVLEGEVLTTGLPETSHPATSVCEKQDPGSSREFCKQASNLEKDARIKPYMYWNESKIMTL